MTEKIKVVYNDCYGCFRLSEEAKNKLKEMLTEKELKNLALFGIGSFPRHDKRLVKVVEELGEKANGEYTDLVVKVLEGTKYRIEEYDGYETVYEPHDNYWVDASKE